MGNLKLTSPAFADGGEIPRECGYKHGNEEPPLSSSGIPEGTPLIVKGGFPFPFLYPHSRGISPPSEKAELVSLRFPICLILHYDAVKFY